MKTDPTQRLVGLCVALVGLPVYNNAWAAFFIFEIDPPVQFC